MDYNTSSTSIEPNSSFQGKDVEILSKELDSKLQMVKRKRLANKYLMSTKTSSASKTSLQKKNLFPERNKTQTLDVEEHPYLPRSVSFDFQNSRICVLDSDDDFNNKSLYLDSQSHSQPYDPIKNYLSPRPQYLHYNPNRHQSRVKRSASYDLGMRFPEEELESTCDCSVEETDIIAPEDEHEDKDEEEMGEVIDEFEEGSGWNWKVFVQYMIVIIALILTTLAIVSMNSPEYSDARESIQGFMNQYKKSYCSLFRTVGFDFSKLGKLSKGVSHDEVWKRDVGDDKMESKQLEGYKTEEIEEVKECKVDEYHDEMWSRNDTVQFQDSESNVIEEKGENSYELIEHEILASEEIYSDFDEDEVSEESEVLEMMEEEEDVGEENGNNIGLDENVLIKMARFDPVFAAFIGVCVIILVTLSMMYYSKKSKISSTNNTKNLESCVNSSPLSHKTTTYSGSFIDLDSVSSSEEQSSYMEYSTNSPSYGSFTVEKEILKKKKSKNPEVMLSPVRRSSRIHNRSFTSP